MLGATTSVSASTSSTFASSEGRFSGWIGAGSVESVCLTTGEAASATVVGGVGTSVTSVTPVSSADGSGVRATSVAAGATGFSSRA